MKNLALLKLRLVMPSLAIAVSFLSFAAAGSIVVSPGVNSSIEGDSNNSFPFNLASLGMYTMRYQQVYNSTEFASLGGPAIITQIAFRPDFETGSAFSSTLNNVQISLSTTLFDASTIGQTFADNLGADDTVVFNGALSLSSSFTGPPAGPKNFDIVINLTAPFVYNPENGNLLLDVRNFAGGSTTSFDSHHLPVSQRVLSGIVTDTAGSSGGDSGLVTQFSFTPVPEPRVSSFLLLGFLALVARRKGSVFALISHPVSSICPSVIRKRKDREFR